MAQCCDKYNISDRAGAALATSVLIDHGITEPIDTKVVIDRSKLGREQMRHREEMRKEEKELFGKVDGIHVDGKKDATIVLKEVDGKYSRKVEIEKHIVMVGQPGKFYLIHTSPDSGTGLSIAASIYNEIKDTDLADKLNVIGSDGTAAMTGAHNGIIRNLEELLHKPAPVQQFFEVSNSSIMSSCHSSSSTKLATALGF